MISMHLLHSIAIWPNLELKTRPRQFLGYVPQSIVLPALSDKLTSECDKENFLNIDTWGQCYKTFSVRDSQIFVLS
jgi:hypothetical protein